MFDQTGLKKSVSHLFAMTRIWCLPRNLNEYVLHFGTSDDWQEFKLRW